jgi:hypothetical protein
MMSKDCYEVLNRPSVLQIWEAVLFHRSIAEAAPSVSAQLHMDYGHVDVHRVFL